MLMTVYLLIFVYIHNLLYIVWTLCSVLQSLLGWK